ncbi:MAG: hypothetical protein A3J46_02840 [Candidatus Yanofskybacteria bacterium RIFCSPHIGHO2_02_FULL_41_11]|uniref:Nucleotidyl transferase domain-containing protein n=1 Tax=Candidatus Yanofskybacteria bacterium RIFCSPHIGHO2_02_FULL_41_11 TaxID=1802675 RepID=A0A1F8F635_9BACT|nr:MAG: hypothetical protein A3J46_02840 [Candidatus Yanofskybacteria bacterium RIFCSPHIGHO2_02_FULL_41_11]
MNTIILAAGRGTRFGELTKKTPKSLVPVNGKPILEYTLSSLPSQINEVVLVIGHLGKNIRNKFGDKHNGKRITYVNAELNGTGGALWQTRTYLKKDRFLVLNGDDIYRKSELENLIKHGWSAGLAKTIPPSSKYLTFELDKDGMLLGARYPTDEEMTREILISTGAFVLNPDIFKYKLVKISNGEYGLPQTILKSIRKHPTKGVIMKNWIQINCLEDADKAGQILKNKKRDLSRLSVD